MASNALIKELKYPEWKIRSTLHSARTYYAHLVDYRRIIDLKYAKCEGLDTIDAIFITKDKINVTLSEYEQILYKEHKSDADLWHLEQINSAAHVIYAHRRYLHDALNAMHDDPTRPDPWLSAAGSPDNC